MCWDQTLHQAHCIDGTFNGTVTLTLKFDITQCYHLVSRDTWKWCHCKHYICSNTTSAVLYTLWICLSLYPKVVMASTILYRSCVQQGYICPDPGCLVCMTKLWLSFWPGTVTTISKPMHSKPWWLVHCADCTEWLLLCIPFHLCPASNKCVMTCLIRTLLLWCLHAYELCSAYMMSHQDTWSIANRWGACVDTIVWSLLCVSQTTILDLKTKACKSAHVVTWGAALSWLLILLLTDVFVGQLRC